ncbi:MAG: DUF2461 domain-containing protein [Jiangellaceae bacterium]
MTFTGIPAEALDFYEGLENDNTKSYWTANKDMYERSVRAPLVALGEVLEPVFGPARLFRPYNDLRFHKGRDPYKEQQGVDLGEHYLHVSAAGLFAATGYYQMASDQVARYRDAVDDARTGPELEAVVRKVRDGGYTVSGETLKTRPCGYDADHPRIELLRHKALVAWIEFGSPPWLHTAEAAARLATALRDMAPLSRWLEENVGPTHALRR